MQVKEEPWIGEIIFMQPTVFEQRVDKSSPLSNQPHVHYLTTCYTINKRRKFRTSHLFMRVWHGD